jgi:hypothetical protein
MGTKLKHKKLVHTALTHKTITKVSIWLSHIHLVPILQPIITHEWWPCAKKKNYQKIVIDLPTHLASKLLHQRVSTSKALFGKCETQTHQRIDVSSCIPCCTQVHSILGVELMLVWFVGTGSTLFAHNVRPLLCALELAFNKSIFHWKRTQ